MYKFLAKQGQHSEIARLLTERFGKPRLSQYSGPRGEGVLITLETQASKRQIDRFLHSQGVVGAHSRRNRFRIVKGDPLMAFYDGKVDHNEIVIFVIDHKMRKGRVIYYQPNCDCCGGWREVEYL